jgi:hypothetical protein
MREPVMVNRAIAEVSARFFTEKERRKKNKHTHKHTHKPLCGHPTAFKGPATPGS